MYPTLYHFFYDWFGVKIQFLRAINSFGFFVAIAFIIGAWLFGKEIERLKFGLTEKLQKIEASSFLRNLRSILQEPKSSKA